MFLIKSLKTKFSNKELKKSIHQGKSAKKEKTLLQGKYTKGATDSERKESRKKKGKGFVDQKRTKVDGHNNPETAAECARH